ncbi:MAG: lysozyme [Gelidibacter sp.]|nr:lysozyme [Gelidibacter sp.]
MKISYTGLQIIKKYEGLSLKPYLCPAGIPTIGYGSTYYEDGSKVTMKDYPITKQKAELLLLNVVVDFERGVNRLVTSTINQNQFDALVSFSYNVGLGSLKSSTLLKRVNNNPQDADICYQFSRWNKAGGKVLEGLTRRRKEEAELYFKEDFNQAENCL